MHQVKDLTIHGGTEGCMALGAAYLCEYLALENPVNLMSINLQFFTRLKFTYALQEQNKE